MKVFQTPARCVGVAAAAAVLMLPAAPALADKPSANVEAQLRPAAGGPDRGFGLVKFRQPKDAETTVFLDVWVRDLAAGRKFLVQRAVDTNVNDDCTGTNWSMPTLGEVTTDDAGTGRADLTRPLPAALLGVEFDIKFRVIDAATSAVVLESACYQFRVSQ